MTHTWTDRSREEMKMKVVTKKEVHCKKYQAKRGKLCKKRVKSYSKWSEHLLEVTQSYNNLVTLSKFHSISSIFYSG